MFKRPGEFHDCLLVFWSRHCSRKGARRVEERKKEEENEDDETRFSPCPGFITLVTISSNLLATVRWGNAREQI